MHRCIHIFPFLQNLYASSVTKPSCLLHWYTTPAECCFACLVPIKPTTDNPDARPSYCYVSPGTCSLDTPGLLISTAAPLMHPARFIMAITRRLADAPQHASLRHRLAGIGYQLDCDSEGVNFARLRAFTDVEGGDVGRPGSTNQEGQVTVDGGKEGAPPAPDASASITSGQQGEDKVCPSSCSFPVSLLTLALCSQAPSLRNISSCPRAAQLRVVSPASPSTPLP